MVVVWGQSETIWYHRRTTTDQHIDKFSLFFSQLVFHIFLISSFASTQGWHCIKETFILQTFYNTQMARGFSENKSPSGSEIRYLKMRNSFYLGSCVVDSVIILILYSATFMLGGKGKDSQLPIRKPASTILN